MGVTGLWKLIDQAGKPVPLETLENKVLAVDISIWLHQVVKGFHDSSGGLLPHAHLLGLFHRVCKLLFYKIKPVFVFDGEVPILKKDTIEKRYQTRNRYQSEADKFQKLLLNTLAKEKIVQQALGESSNLLKSPLKATIISQKQQEREDIFKLPPIKDPDYLSLIYIDNVQAELSDESDNENSSFLERKRMRHFNGDIKTIDITSSKFQSIPADIRVELLNDLKETRKQSSWRRLHELPSDSNEFSSYQMKGLLKRRQVQTSLENAEKEMGGECLSLAEMEILFREGGIVKDDNETLITKRIAFDEHTKFIHVPNNNNNNSEEENKTQTEDLCSPPKILKLTNSNNEAFETLSSVTDIDIDFNNDLQEAIQLSLQDLSDNLSKHNSGKSCGTNKNSCLSHTVITAMKNEQDTSIPSTASARTDNIFVISDTNDSDVSSTADSDFLEVPDFVESDSSNIELNIVQQSKLNDSPVSNLLNDFRFSDLEKKPIPIALFIEPNDFNVKNDIFADVFATPVNTTSKTTIQPPKTVSSAITSKTVNLIETNENKIVKQNTIQDILTDLNTEITSITKLNLDNLSSLSSSIAVPKLTNQNISPNKCTTMFDNINEMNTLVPSAPAIDNNENCQSDTFPTNDINIVKSDDQVKIQGTKEIESRNNDKTTCDSDKQSNISHNGVLIHGSKSPETIEPISVDNTNNTAINEIESRDSDSVQNNKTICDLDNQSETLYTDLLNDKNNSSIDNSKVKLIEVTSVEVNKSHTVDDNVSDTEEYVVNKEITIIRKEICGESDDIVTIDLDKGNEAIKSTASNIQSQLEAFLNKIPKSTSNVEEGKTERKSLDLENSQKELVENVSLDADVSTTQPLVIPDVLHFQAETLRKHKNKAELITLANDLRNERVQIEKQRNTQDRMGMSITEYMNNECKELLKLFGIPYVNAPMEAEAQCAYLNAANLTDGTITDDSDIWLFGAKTVYKHFFNQSKNVLQFQYDNIEKLYNIDRKKFIQIALLVGSDYTAGISGIGAVTSLEILSHFAETSVKDGETSLLSNLRKFRDWYINRSQHNNSKNSLRNKLKNIELNSDFPSVRVVEAYLHPKVDESLAKFTWGYPDVESIKEFAKDHLGWTYNKTNEILLPVLKKLDEKKNQQSIKKYFQVQSSSSTRPVNVSKRVRKAIDKLSPNYKDRNNGSDGDDDKSSTKITNRKKRNVKRNLSKPDDNVEIIDLDNDYEQINMVNNKVKMDKRKGTRNKSKPSDTKIYNNANILEAGPSGSNDTPKNSKKLRNYNVPQKEQPIPQREKAKEKMEQNKVKAIGVFKNNRKNR